MIQASPAFNPGVGPGALTRTGELLDTRGASWALIAGRPDNSAMSVHACRCFQRCRDSFDMVDSARMLSFDDERWNQLTGGYKIPFDPRPSLRKLESQQDTAAAWEELWEELHHQGDVGDAS